jgi:hypothetical protein
MDYCVPCNRHFASKEARKQHERNSPVHNKKVHCQTCDCLFGTKEALEQHQQYSTVHNKIFHCKDCNSSFGSNKTLKNHRRFCQAASSRPLDPVDTSLCQERDGRASSNTWPRSPTVDPRSLLQRFARMFVSAVPPTITTHPQLAREHVSKATQETREFFMFPELYHGLR